LPEKFLIILIKPTRYGEDGYPVRWKLPILSSSALSCIYGLADDCRRRKFLGAQTDIILKAYDESYQVVDTAGLLRQLGDGGRAFVGFVGVQSNQFPRAVDLARPFLDHHVPVCIGGFHVSGCMAMLPELPADIKQAQAMGISLFAGEAEQGRLEQVLKDAYEGRLQPVYNFINDLPAIENQPVPVLPPGQVRHFTLDGYENLASFDLGRGCPFECSFCSVINVHGRKNRFRSPDDLERIIRPLHEAGIGCLFICDDNFSRNKNWKKLFDRLITLRESENIKFRIVLQVDMLSYKNPLFIEKAVKAGVNQLFIGLETINSDNLTSMKKRQNNIEDYREMLLAWKKHPVVIIAGFIIGLPADTRQSILRDIEIIKRELPVDLLTFSYLTPLPGSMDHKIVLERGGWIDPDMNKYDLTHRVASHPKMSDQVWEQVYKEAWESYYSPGHIKTVLKRAAALGSDLKLTTASLLLIAKYNNRYFGIQTFDGTLARIRRRHERRPGLPQEGFLPFLYRDLKERLIARIGFTYHYFRLWLFVRRLWKDPQRFAYTDIAIARSSRDER